MAMARTQTMVQLTDELVAELDEEASRLQVSRSHLIRQVLDEFLSERRPDEALKRYVEGYRHTPQAIPDEWGDLATSTAQSARELGRRLDAEETARGLEW